MTNYLIKIDKDGYLFEMPPASGDFKFSDDIDKAFVFSDHDARIATDRMIKKGWPDVKLVATERKLKAIVVNPLREANRQARHALRIVIDADKKRQNKMT